MWKAHYAFWTGDLSAHMQVRRVMVLSSVHAPKGIVIQPGVGRPKAVLPWDNEMKVHNPKGLRQVRHGFAGRLFILRTQPLGVDGKI
jgi:hypothetical protein